MLPLSDWLFLLGACLGGAMTPGLSLIMVTRHTIAGGVRHGTTVAVTHALGIAVWASLSVSGLAFLFAHTPELQQLISMAGAVVLLVLAWQGWRNSQPFEETAATLSSSAATAALDGFAIALVNPKVAVFFIALFSQFLGDAPGMVIQIQMVLTASLVDGLWYALVAIMIGRSGLLAWLKQQHHRIERATAMLLALIAVGVIYDNAF